MKIRCKKTGKVFDAVILDAPYERAVERRCTLRGKPGDIAAVCPDGLWPVSPEAFDSVYEMVEE